MACDPEVKAAAFKRDRYRCRHCGGMGIQPHHMKYVSVGGQDTLENVLTLDAGCHTAHHKGFLSIEWGEHGANGYIKFTRQRGWVPS